jgi:hypothetical protein
MVKNSNEITLALVTYPASLKVAFFVVCVYILLQCSLINH